MSEDKNMEEKVEKLQESDKKIEVSVKDLEKKIETLEIEKDLLQRSLAKQQNDQREKENTSRNKLVEETKKIKYKLLEEFTTIYEDFIRAQDSLSKNNVDTSGIEIIRKNMEKILASSYNIIPIDTIGKPFDPQIHEAVQMVEDDLVDEGTIIQEVAKGYYAEEGILKPSKVIVSKKKSEN